VNLRFAIGDWRHAKVFSVGIWQFAIWGVFVCQGASAGKNSSLSESKIESAKAKVTATALLSQNDELRRQLSLERESIKTLTESLAESNAEAELFRRKYSALQLRMEALGLESADKDRAKLEQRLLNAVSDLQLFRKEREQYGDQMLRLTEAVLHFLKTAQSSDPQARMRVETQLRSLNELIGKSANEAAETRATQPTLMDGSVISVKEEWSLVVGNLGEQQGVKMGMPLRVVRDDKLIATLRVVDVRQKICGAVIQEMGSEKEKIKMGDRLQADARQDVSLK
jgi:hypothetical protein